MQTPETDALGNQVKDLPLLTAYTMVFNHARDLEEQRDKARRSCADMSTERACNLIDEEEQADLFDAIRHLAEVSKEDDLQYRTSEAIEKLVCLLPENQ